MKSDTDAVGGFFEDLPVLAFVLAGVLSVAGTACWTNEMLSEGEISEILERTASQLVTGVVLELRGPDGTLTIGSVIHANLSRPLSALPYGVACVVSIWCVHPENDILLVVASGGGDPEVARSSSVLVNALCGGGIICILEVRGLVWTA